MLSTKREPSTNPELVLWVNLLIATGEKTTAQKSCISKRAWSGLKIMPTGCCIQPLATKIQRAERLEPIATSQVERR